jgi:hypothetical protein
MFLFILNYKVVIQIAMVSLILLDKKNKRTTGDIRLALEKENIESRPLWKPMHMHVYV